VNPLPRRARSAHAGRAARFVSFVAGALAAVVCSWSSVGPAQATEPAAGGPPFLAASESATATVVGVVRKPVHVDLSGFGAELEIERTLAGAAPGGAAQRIAWEELAPSRPSRFSEGDRILVALVPLPSASIWLQRFPRSPESAPVLAVAADGDAFVRSPDAETVTRLERFLVLDAPGRDAAPGASALASLIAGAQPVVLATSAVTRLDQIAGLETKLDADAREQLRTAALDPHRPRDVRVALLELFGRRRLTAFRPTLEQLAQPGSPLEADALAALGALDGGLSPEVAERLLTRGDPAVRVVAVRYVTGPKAEERVAGLVRSDPSPEVRAAATQVIVARRGAGAVQDALPALSDPDRSVRAAGAYALGAIGEPAVPALKQLALTRGPDDAAAAIAALSLAGKPGAIALVEIAKTHPNPKVRTLAQFALGKAPGENHAPTD
jgi:hypothetical protein